MVRDARKRRDRAWCRRVRAVLADGVDVTRDCFKVDGRRRLWWSYARDTAGKLQVLPSIGELVVLRRRARRIVVVMRQGE